MYLADDPNADISYLYEDKDCYYLETLCHDVRVDILRSVKRLVAESEKLVAKHENRKAAVGAIVAKFNATLGEFNDLEVALSYKLFYDKHPLPEGRKLPEAVVKIL